LFVIIIVIVIIIVVIGVFVGVSGCIGEGEVVTYRSICFIARRAEQLAKFVFDK
jgi:hypothetical protein